MYKFSLRFIRSIHYSTQLYKGAFPYYNKHKPVTDPQRQDPNYFENEAEKFQLDSHYLNNLKLLWEEKIGNTRDLQLKAADLLVGNTANYGLPNIDCTALKIEYRKVDLLKSAPKPVKKIFSVDMGERFDLTAAWKHELINKVNIHQFDKGSYQSKVAWATACIRHYTALADTLIALHKQKKRPTWLLNRIFLLVGWRTKMLRVLREKDFAEFERVLKELKIAYHISKEPEHIYTRKAWSEHQLRRRCIVEKEKRLNSLQKKILENRDANVSLIDAELSVLEAEKKIVKERLLEISNIEGKSVQNSVAKYQPKLVEEFSEIMLHSILFYHPPPRQNFRTVTH